MALENARRDAIWRLLNEDADRLLMEMDANTQRRLREELKICTQKFVQLSSQALEIGEFYSRVVYGILIL